MGRPKLNAVLVIDDEEANEFITKIFLQRANCAEQILSVNDASDGLAILEHQEIPEIILLDINMPAMDAWQFVQEARRIMQGRLLPFIVILSSSVSRTDQERATENPDIHMFVSKPLNQEKVNEILDQYFLMRHEN